jgi:glutaminyl-tRNA synthetase
LKSAYIIQCVDYKKDEKGEVSEVYCTYDEATRSGGPEAGRKVKGTLHWVSARHAVEAEVRLYDRLFSDPDPAGHKDRSPVDFLNPESLKVITAYVEPSLKQAKVLDHFQFQRLGYFNVDPDSTSEKRVFNRTVTLRDNWSKRS